MLPTLKLRQPFKLTFDKTTDGVRVHPGFAPVRWLEEKTLFKKSGLLNVCACTMATDGIKLTWYMAFWFDLNPRSQLTSISPALILKKINSAFRWFMWISMSKFFQVRHQGVAHKPSAQSHKLPEREKFLAAVSQPGNGFAVVPSLEAHLLCQNAMRGVSFQIRKANSNWP